jgi:hypothetical protein
MYLVAIISLATPIETEAPLLAAALGQTAYEARILLADDPPWLVLRTADRGAAVALVGALRARRHEVVACDAAAVTAFAAMTSVDSLSDAGLHAGDELVPFADLVAIVRLTVRKTWQTTKKETKREVAVGMALATGGVILSKKVTKEHTQRHEEREQLLVFFRRGGPPWLAGERDLDYGALPGGAGRTAAENFERFVELARTRATAPYDDRFLRAKRPANDRALVRNLEERVHVLALALARNAPQPDQK